MPRTISTNSLSNTSRIPKSTACCNRSSRLAAGVSRSIPVASSASPKLLGDVTQAALSAAKQAVEELQDARMPPDRAQRLSDLDGRAFPQLRQALHQLAGLGRAERADGDLMEVGLHARDRVAAGEEQSATRRVLGQQSEEQADVGVEEGTAAHGEVLLEVVEHQHHGIFGQGLAEEMEACSVVEVCRQQQGGLLLQLVAFGSRGAPRPGWRRSPAGRSDPRVQPPASRPP